MTNKKLALYFDMDGVQADFEKALQGQFERMFKRGFFRNIEPIGTPNTVFARLQQMGYEVYILTTAVKTAYCDTEKIEWVAEHAPSIKPENIIICKTGDHKTDFIKTPIETSVLIDDYKENLHTWQNAGGIAVKFARHRKTSRPYHQICLDLAEIIPLVEQLESEVA